VFYTSSGAAYPLFVNASLLDMNATLDNVMIKTGPSSSPASATPRAPASSSPAPRSRT
jgi:hypothetical protein